MARTYRMNAATGELDIVMDTVVQDVRYVEVAGDTMTGSLTITPVLGTEALKSDKNIVLKSGQKLIFDGD